MQEIWGTVTLFYHNYHHKLILIFIIIIFLLCKEEQLTEKIQPQKLLLINFRACV